MPDVGRSATASMKSQKRKEKPARSTPADRPAANAPPLACRQAITPGDSSTLTCGGLPLIIVQGNILST